MSEAYLEAILGRGKDLLRQQNFSAATESFREAARYDPTCRRAHEGLATVAYSSGDFAAAIFEYETLTQLAPNEARYYTNLGALHNRIADYQKACDYLRKAIQRDKTCAGSYYNLGIAQRKLNQNAMAVSAYKEAIRIDPMMLEAYLNLGNLYVDMGSLHMAVANFRKALEIRPDSEKARAGLFIAEQQQLVARGTNNQIDRLNAIQSTVKTVAQVGGRELRWDERYADRSRVKRLADDIERLAKGCVEHLNINMEPAILRLERAMARGVADSFGLNEAAETFKFAAAQWNNMRGMLKRKLTELAEYERSINSD